MFYCIARSGVWRHYSQRTSLQHLLTYHTTSIVEACSDVRYRDVVTQQMSRQLTIGDLFAESPPPPPSPSPQGHGGPDDMPPDLPLLVLLQLGCTHVAEEPFNFHVLLLFLNGCGHSHDGENSQSKDEPLHYAVCSLIWRCGSSVLNREVLGNRTSLSWHFYNKNLSRGALLCLELEAWSSFRAVIAHKASKYRLGLRKFLDQWRQVWPVIAIGDLKSEDRVFGTVGCGREKQLHFGSCSFTHKHMLILRWQGEKQLREKTSFC